MEQQRAPVAMTIGVFDGVHRGHQDLISRMIAHARVSGLDTVAVTFDPHPQALLHPEAPAPTLGGIEERTDLLRENGVDEVHIVAFTPQVAAQSPEEFIATLRERYEPRHIHVGSAFALGHDRAGTIDALQSLGRIHGFTVTSVPLLTHQGRAISSTWIREALASGDVELAHTLLGRPYAIRGIVQPGMQRGRHLGFPTANIAPPPDRALPADGVYYVNVRVLQPPPSQEGGEYEWDSIVRKGVVNLGGRPTFGETERLLETHVLDYSGDLYGAYMSVELIAQLRGTKKFSGIDELREQIERDIAAARELAAT